MHRTFQRCVVVAAAFFLLTGLGISAAGTAPCDPGVLKERLMELHRSAGPTVDGAPIASVSLLTPVYEHRDYRPAWGDTDRVEELLRLVDGSVRHGLDPEDFHARRIRERLQSGRNDPGFLADSEILASDALARLAVTLHFGKLDPSTLDSAWNFDRSYDLGKPAEVMGRALDSHDLVAFVEALAPQSPFYTRLVAALARYRKIEAAGGWQEIPAGPVLRSGDRGPRVAALRQRLEATDDLAGPAPPDAELYDDAVEEAVKRFQRRCGLDQDGKVGPQTLQELNVPVRRRIDQIRANLERDRWVFRDIPANFIIVDIAGYRVHLFRKGREVWSTRVQVGMTKHQTPVFRSAMKTVVLNPTWTVPPGILRRETLPRIRKDPSYLASHHMVVITRSGKIVDPSTIDWAATAKGGFPYMVRQEPGPWNALGRVKFLFPNPYMVYLHDTPSTAKFERAERAFSHGCIRTEHPLELAALLLEGQGWDRKRIDEVVASRKNTTIRLEDPLPVLLLYWTAEAADDGTVFFRRDLYGRDGRIISGLAKPLAVHPPKGAVPPA